MGTTLCFFDKYWELTVGRIGGGLGTEWIGEKDAVPACRVISNKRSFIVYYFTCVALLCWAIRAVFIDGKIIFLPISPLLGCGDIRKDRFNTNKWVHDYITKLTQLIRDRDFLCEFWLRCLINVSRDTQIDFAILTWRSVRSAFRHF